MGIHITRIASHQLTAAMTLTRRVFMAFVAPEYSMEGVDSFLEYIEENAMQKRLANEEISLWGAYHKETLAGVIAMRPPCAVSLLFVDKPYQRNGIARRLLTHALNEYRIGVCDVTVHASPYAVPAYRRMGFKAIGGEEVSSGIRFQPMVLSGL